MEANRDSTAPRILKTFVALLAGALVPAIIVSVAFSRSFAATDPASLPGDRLSGAGIAFLIALTFTAAHVFVLGAPLLLLGIKLRLVRWWSVLAAGFVIGFVPSAWAAGASSLASALPMGALGLIGGAAFWLVWHSWVQRGPGVSAKSLAHSSEA